MIKVTITDILNGTEILQKLSNTGLKAKLAWQVSRLLKAVDKEVQEFNETRMELIKKYGEKDESGELITDDKGNCKIITENVEKFSAELNELVASEIEINANKIKMDDLENIDFTPSEMVALEPFIETNEE